MNFYSQNFELDTIQDQKFTLFAIFHDVVYDPLASKGDNEKNSADIFLEYCNENEIPDEI